MCKCVSVRCECKRYILNKDISRNLGTTGMEERRKNISKLITSVSNFSVQYNFQAIAIALLVMSSSVCTSDDVNCRGGDQASWVRGTAAATIFIGAIVGQVSMGYLGDLIGRNKALFFTLCLASLGALGSAILPDGNASSIYTIIIICRLVLGVGVGGVYPLSATKAAEDSPTIGNKPNCVESAKSFFWQVYSLFILFFCYFFFRMTADKIPHGNNKK